MVEEWLIRRKIIEGMCEPARVDIALLLHIDDAASFDRGDSFQAVLASVELGKARLPRYPFQASI